MYVCMQCIVLDMTAKKMYNIDENSTALIYICVCVCVCVYVMYSSRYDCEVSVQH